MEIAWLSFFVLREKRCIFNVSLTHCLQNSPYLYGDVIERERDRDKRSSGIDCNSLASLSISVCLTPPPPQNYINMKVINILPPIIKCNTSSSCRRNARKVSCALQGIIHWTFYGRCLKEKMVTLTTWKPMRI